MYIFLLYLEVKIIRTHELKFLIMNYLTIVYGKFNFLSRVHSKALFGCGNFVVVVVNKNAKVFFLLKILA